MRNSHNNQPGRLYTSLAMQVTAYILGTIVTRMWKALPWSFITQANKRQLELYARAECQGKAFQAIVYLLFSSEGVAPGYQHRQADVYCLPGKFSPLHYYLAFPIFPHDISTEPEYIRLILNTYLYTILYQQTFKCFKKDSMKTCMLSQKKLYLQNNKINSKPKYRLSPQKHLPHSANNQRSFSFEEF